MSYLVFPVARENSWCLNCNLWLILKFNSDADHRPYYSLVYLLAICFPLKVKDVLIIFRMSTKRFREILLISNQMR